jgi:flagellar biosynthesis/type III secretory pathway chaperone
MAGMIDQLIGILNEQAERCTELLGLSKEKKDLIISNDGKGIQKITDLENILISQNNKLEKKRAALMKDVAIVLGKDEKNGPEMTVSELIESMDGQEEQEALKETAARIRGILTELSDINVLNASLVDNALDYVEYSLNLIRTGMNKNPAVYNLKNGEPAEESNLYDVKN